MANGPRSRQGVPAWLERYGGQVRVALAGAFASSCPEHSRDRRSAAPSVCSSPRRRRPTRTAAKG
ncbi:MAG: hypothetical protein DMG07_15435 [Acidobacteria bacterium]|nr:MAG: hypothetical protein DMG07_15435 [Acidobacteriota bacterium]